MKELSITIKTILKVIKEHLDIVPALGNATEELNIVDAEEKEEEIAYRELQNVDTFLETPPPSEKFIKVSPLFRKDENFFQYFMDGTYRHYFLATGLEHNNSTPIFLAQISASVVHRNQYGKLTLADKLNKVFILLAKERVSSTAWNKIQEVMEKFKKDNIELYDLSGDDILSGKFDNTTDLRRRGEVKVRFIMSQLERDLMIAFREKNLNGWFIKDGILRYGSFDANVTLEKTIGVSKRMSSTQTFFVKSAKEKKKESTINLLKELPFEHRTPVYCGIDAKTGFWYLRLRKVEQITYPLFGIVKIEIPNLETQPITKELVDKISSALLGERFVTPYGSDLRWHAHLYPIFRAEQAAKGNFYSKEVIQGLINWK